MVYSSIVKDRLAVIAEHCPAAAASGEVIDSQNLGSLRHKRPAFKNRARLRILAAFMAPLPSPCDDPMPTMRMLRAPLLLLISVLLLLGQMGAVTHTFEHLRPSTEAHFAAVHDGGGDAVVDDACLICAAYAALGHAASHPAPEVFDLAVVQVLVAAAAGVLFLGRLRLAYRSRAPPIVS